MAESYSDVALVVMNINEAVRSVVTPKSLRLTFGPPKLKQNTMALGYHVTGPVGPGTFSVSHDLKASRGEVTQLHERYRDKVMVNFPAFETTGLYMPAMSGGPIIDVDGAVVGLITTGFDTSDDEPPIGHGACAGALAELKVELTNDQEIVEEFPIAKLAEMGILGADGVKLRLDRNDEGVLLTWPTE
jgi:hypothetical protein